MRRFVPALLLSFAALASTANAAGTPPDAVTAAATNIGPLGAQLNGTANANGHATNVRFQYGTTTKYGKSTPAQAKQAAALFTSPPSPATGRGTRIADYRRGESRLQPVAGELAVSQIFATSAGRNAFGLRDARTPRDV